MTLLGTLRLAAELAPGLLRARIEASRGRAHPPTSGRFEMQGAHETIEIVRDEHGLPHVFAQNETDAMFGQGVVHAQDRLFQMDAMRRLASGRVAEVGGSVAVESDQFMRRVGLVHRARRDIELAAADDVELLEAYAAGVNAGIAALPELPPEYRLIGTEPEPWRPEHTTLIGRLVMFSFAVNWDTELLRERLLQAVGPARAALLDPAYGVDRATHTGEPYPGSAERLLHAYESAVAGGLPAGMASNAWAVSPSRSSTGAPLLASDPHIEARIPSLFHATHVSGGSFDTIGADVAGIPGVAIGHNQRLAWGLTAGLADIADCFVETVDPQNPARYRTPNGWEQASERVEEIKVRGEVARTEVVLETRHGPVIQPAAPGTDRAIALRATTLEDGDIVTPSLGMLRARTPEDFETVLDGWHGATFGFVYAHVDGTIGHRLAGDVPVREPGEGLLPSDGATSPGPSAVRRPEELPGGVNPPEGFAITANNAAGGNGDLGEEWCEPWRAERIATLLRATEQHDVGSFEAIQTDRRSEALLQLRDLLLAASAGVEPGIVEMLRDWDGQLAPDSAGGALVSQAYRDVARRLVQRLAGSSSNLLTREGSTNISSMSSFDYRMQGWLLDQLATPRAPAFRDAAERDRALRGAIARAADELAEDQGTDPRRWEWGRVHTLRYAHSLESVPLLRGAYSRGPYPGGGDVNTIWQSSYPTLRRGESVQVTPAYRQVIDLADFDRSRFQLSTGSSGIPGHPRYDDCIDEYRAGVSRPLLYTRAAVDAATTDTTVIVPVGQGE
ncbi:MAG: penicillin acylase family protein [Dehalococcoidia bacterium]|nr:penicillin acylase family protein [Dehalococcoidia bacterium]